MPVWYDPILLIEKIISPLGYEKNHWRFSDRKFEINLVHAKVMQTKKMKEKIFIQKYLYQSKLAYWKFCPFKY